VCLLCSAAGWTKSFTSINVGKKAIISMVLVMIMSVLLTVNVVETDALW